MHNLRLFVEFQSYAMTAKVCHDSIAILLTMLLDGMTDIAYETVRLCCLHTNFQTFLGNTHKLFLLGSCLTYDEHTRGICIITVKDSGEIHIYNITFLKNILFLWNAVTYHLIDACTYRLRESLIVEAGRNSVMILAILHADIIYLLSVHSCVDMLCYLIQNTRVHNTGTTYAFYLLVVENQIASRHKLTFALPVHHLLIHLGERLTGKTMPTFFLCHFICFLCNSTIKFEALFLI